MQGRKPKPTALKILEGNRGHRPLPENEPKPQIALLEAPDYLKEDEIAIEEWDRIVPELYLLDLLTNVDRATLELYCTQYSLYRQAMVDIKENGLISENARHGEKPNPSIAIAREAGKMVKSMAVEFGLTPSARVRLSVPDKPDEEDPLEEMLKD